MSKQPQTTLEKQRLLQKAIYNGINNPTFRNDEFKNLKTSLQKIAQEKAYLSINRIERESAKEQYQDDVESLRFIREETIRQDNRTCSRINDHMMSVNKMCEEYNVPKMFPAASKDYSYNQIENAAINYISEIDAIDESNYDLQREKSFENLKSSGLIRRNKETLNRDQEISNIMNDINTNIENTMQKE